MDLGIETIKGKTLKKIERSPQEEDDYIIFIVSEDEQYKMHHRQNCCESVYIEDICGELEWLVGEPILVAEERTNKENPLHEDDESFSWTFYELATIKGSVTIRWYGSSNGYYSEDVYFEKIKR